MEKPNEDSIEFLDGKTGTIPLFRVLHHTKVGLSPKALSTIVETSHEGSQVQELFVSAEEL
jgi:hypothetical protein